MSNDQLEESSSDSQLTSPEYPLAATPFGCVESSQRSKVDTENANVNARSENEIKRTFLWHTHNYLNEYIRFCDKKAALTGTISTGLIGAMYSAGVYIPLLIKPRDQWNLSTWLTVLAVASLLISVILVVATVAPRLSTEPKVFCIGEILQPMTMLTRSKLLTSRSLHRTWMPIYLTTLIFRRTFVFQNTVAFH